MVGNVVARYGYARAVFTVITRYALVALYARSLYLPICGVGRVNAFGRVRICVAVGRGNTRNGKRHFIAVVVGVGGVVHASVTPNGAFIAALTLNERTFEAHFLISLRIEIKRIAQLQGVVEHIEEGTAVSRHNLVGCYATR